MDIATIVSRGSHSYRVKLLKPVHSCSIWKEDDPEHEIDGVSLPAGLVGRVDNTHLTVVVFDQEKPSFVVRYSTIYGAAEVLPYYEPYKEDFDTCQATRDLVH